MSELRQFAQRYYHVKKQVENLEELRFAHVTRKYADLSVEVEAIKTERQRAEEERNSGQTGADWLMWHRYVQLLETVEEAHNKDLQTVGLERDTQQKSLWAAHVESTRWETLANKLTYRHQVEMQRLDERSADEMAVLRNKGGL